MVRISTLSILLLLACDFSSPVAPREPLPTVPQVTSADFTVAYAALGKIAADGNVEVRHTWTVVRVDSAHIDSVWVVAYVFRAGLIYTVLDRVAMLALVSSETWTYGAHASGEMASTTTFPNVRTLRVGLEVRSK